MNKKLTPLERVLARLVHNLMYTENAKQCDKDIETLKSALKNYEELLKRPCVIMGRTNGYTQALMDAVSKNHKEIKITSLDDQKNLKAFKIIKRKKVNTGRIFIGQYNTLEEYNMWENEDRKLTREEYDLLKEVLINE